MTEIVTSGSMSGVGKRSDGAAYTGTKPETADTAKASTWTPPRPASTLLATHHGSGPCRTRAPTMERRNDETVRR